MLNFLKSILKSVFVTLISFFVILSVLVLIGLSTSQSDGETTINDQTVLEIRLNENIVDRSSEFDFDINSLMNEDIALGLNQILKSIEKARYDDRVKGIYLNVQSINAGSATINEIRHKLQTFKDSTDKFIVAYSEVYTQSAYYLSSVAHKVYLHPEGAIEFKGLSYEGMFFKGALKKLNVEAQIIRHGKFKSAVEPYILDKMSVENREQVSLFVSTIWNNLKSQIAQSRNLSISKLDNIADSLLVKSAKDAVEYHLADALLYEDQVNDTLKKLIQVQPDDKVTKVSLKEYASVGVNTGKKYSKDKIAIIYAQGTINSGKGDNQSIGSETTSKAIRKARKDDKIQAIVLRVNSPGGSALASETILREMELAKTVKPVIVSMGDVAASGGYYIACKADTIVANPTTITGSIGVFGVVPNIEGMLENKLGITTDRVNTNKYSDLGSITRPLTTREKAIIKNQIERIYDTFISHVASGRNLKKEDVDAVGQGRVWTGEDAKRLGLVDVLGGLEDAVSIAAKMANIDNYRVTNLPKLKNPIEEFFTDFSVQIKHKLIKDEIGQSYLYYKQLNEIQNMDRIQMRMPMQFEIY
ncbi:MAG: signal peptide peptidase SppA [Flavobacteriales bacterium]